MSQTVRQLRVALRRVSRGRGGQGRRYPAELRDAVVRHAVAERKRGVSVGTTSSSLGLSYQTLHSWLVGRAEARLRPVTVTAVASEVTREPSTLSLVTAHGHRVEGLSRDDVAFLLRALS